MQMRHQHPFRRRRAFTLLEVSLVVGLLVLLTAMVVPSLYRQFRADSLPRSAKQLRSLITLVRANASFDNMRYRIRFPNEDEKDLFGGDSQPLIEREDDPIDEPEVFNVVTDPWAIEPTFMGDVWCAEVRLGKPTIERLRELRERSGDDIERELEDAKERDDKIDPDRPPLFIEPDGSSEWVTFVLTTAPRRTALDDLPDHPQLHLIADGGTGLAWLQRRFYDEEIDLFEEKNWPAVLRQDLLSPGVLTEDDVLEIRERQIRGSGVKLKGRELQTEAPQP
jgi:type II secretory pathway pseudopilin PulG